MAKAKKLNAAKVEAEHDFFTRFGERLSRWAIKIRRKDGTAFLVTGGDFMVKLFNGRTGALDYAEELGEHIERRRMKVVRVEVTIREIVKERARLDAVKAKEAGNATN